MKGKNRGKKPANWKGGFVDSLGYILRFKPSHPHANSRGYIQEARLVMEEHLGRYLRPEEVVHHANGDKVDNRIENLRVFGSQAEHIAFHHLKRKGLGVEGGQRDDFLG